VAALGALAAPACAAEQPDLQLAAFARPGWLSSNPFPQSDTLHAVAFSGSIGYAAGEDGALLRSSDGGRSWSTLASGTEDELAFVQELDPLTVIIGGRCELLESVDGGAAFRQMNFPGSGCDLVAVSFVSASSGYVVEKNGDVAFTENGGRSFLPRTALPVGEGEPEALDFISGSVGFALVAAKEDRGSGSILRTEDGGFSWQQVGSSAHALSAITFVGSGIGYAVGSHGTMLGTSDRGLSWQALPLALSHGEETRELSEISCANAESCLMSDRSETLVRTSDGGHTASEVVPLAPIRGEGSERSRIGGVWMLSERDAAAVGEDGAAALSDNGGASWPVQSERALPFPVTEEPRIRLGATPRDAYLPARYGLIAATSNEGRTWSLLRVPTEVEIVDVAFPTRRRGFALTHNGSVFRTSDGGRSWQHCGRAGSQPASLLAPNTRIVVVAARFGIWRSTDSCRHFAPVGGVVQARGKLRSLASVELDGGAELVPGAMLAWGYVLLESTDDGASWTVLPGPPNLEFIHGVSFLNARTGYVLFYGRLFFTKDAGASWKEDLSLPMYELAEPPALGFASAQRGFVATRFPDESARNVIYRTEDGGRTWIPSGLPSYIGAITAVPGLAYATEEFGRAVHVTHGSGLLGARSHLSLEISGPDRMTFRVLKRGHRRVSVHGQLTPAVAGAEIVVSYLTGGSWGAERVHTDVGGRFAITLEDIRGTSWFVAQWTGDETLRGAGTEAKRLTVAGG
jgi:photosystem II stability/assembly factor-like uncharacterized protein